MSEMTATRLAKAATLVMLAAGWTVAAWLLWQTSVPESLRLAHVDLDDEFSASVLRRSARYDGFLRWAYDAWPADPMRDARHTAWPAGDTYMVYPGGESSVRFEKLREGIVDFEKIRVLRAMFTGSADPQVQRLMGELGQLLDSIGTARDTDEARAMEALSAGTRAIAALSEAAP